MTVRKPMQSPTSPRSKVATPWPTTKDTSKPLPETPEQVPEQTPIGTADGFNDRGKEHSISPERKRRSKRQASQDEKASVTSSPPRDHAHLSTESTTRDLAPIVTPKSSTESQRSLPNIPGSTRPLNPAKASAGSRIKPSPQNPFRQKKALLAQPEATYEDSNAIWATDREPGKASALPHQPLAVDTAHHRSSSQISQEAPRLDWQDNQSPIDLSGFSGTYFNDLGELQQNILNSSHAKSSSHESNEKEVAANTGDPSAPPIGMDFDGSSKSQAWPRAIQPPEPTPRSSIQAQDATMSPDSKSRLPIPPSTSYQATASAEKSGPPFSTPSDPTMTDFEQLAIAPLPPPRTNTLSEGLATNQNRASPKPRKQSETYQIRQINWFDATSPTNPRRSPIMVQNANGPCPLLALVNALVISTPSTLITALIETLRVREQVSLGLLLDAVIDELMSGRRGEAAQNLPDVSDLYSFLLTLHTGMNVNPRFVPFNDHASLIDAPIDMPSPTDFRRPGGFEDTREMNLYSTFAVPLIHGWIPPRTHPAFEALKRAAKTYEDAQNILFREEELEEKLRNQGLASDEQSVLEDVASIKYFLSSTATQLTGYGLDSITECLAPGSISILFRNDHFSTLYKHPKTGQLLTLVTDMGYAGHDEVVWESLVDVSGEGSEFFAGDFRPVSNVVETTEEPGVDQEGWETITRKPRRPNRASQSSHHGPSQQGTPISFPAGENLKLHDHQQSTVGPKSTEQEDHDLALAMQLQEEEEDRLRRDTAARRHEDELSQRYLNNADPATGRRTFPGFGRGARGGGAPQVPPRGGGVGGGSRSARQAPPVVRRRNSGDDAPPSYEQAAKVEPYHPPPNHPSHPTSSPGPTGASSARPAGLRNRQSSSAYAEQAANSGGGTTGIPPSPAANRQFGGGVFDFSRGGAGQNPPLPRRPRRTGTERSSGGGHEEEGKEEASRKKEKDCCVM